MIKQMWVVIEAGDTISDTRVYGFEDTESAVQFSAKTEGKSRSSPIALSLARLEQASPIVVVAFKVMAHIPVALFCGGDVSRRTLDEAANFLSVAVDFARLDPNIEDIFRETHKLLLYQSEHPEEPERTIQGVQACLEKLPKV
jgi:hypothetical protein